MARLSTASGKEIDLAPGRQYVLGRDPFCEIVVDDHSCSRRHLLISVDVEDDCITLQDLDSLNGTYLNGEKLTEVVVAMEGSEIGVGGTRFVVSYEGADAKSMETTAIDSVEAMLLLGDSPNADLPSDGDGTGEEGTKA